MSETMTLIGPSGEAATVASSALSVRLKSDYQKAIEDGDAYSWASLTYDPDGIDTILAVENNSATKNLHIQEIHIQSDAAGQFVVHTGSGVAIAGTAAVVGVNLNRNSGNAASATAICDETTNTASTAYTGRLYTGIVAADGNVVIKVDGAVILPNDHFIGVDLTTAATAANVTVVGYYKTR